jgi:hypothetical protein
MTNCLEPLTERDALFIHRITHREDEELADGGYEFAYELIQY